MCVLAEHVSHLENVSEDEINRLLGMVVDVENLFMSVHKEEDTDTKQVYFYLFKVNLPITFPTRYTEYTPYAPPHPRNVRWE